MLLLVSWIEEGMDNSTPVKEPLFSRFEQWIVKKNL
jgi:hypothetical protein